MRERVSLDFVEVSMLFMCIAWMCFACVNVYL